MMFSICIPTYNRAGYLIELMSSIEISSKAANAEHDVEICISDNDSSDNTRELVEKYIESSNLQISYELQAENIGPDRNYLECTKNAVGKYIWFMGSDDLLDDNSISRMFSVVSRDPDLLLCDRYNCDFLMNKVGVKKWLNLDGSLFEFNFSKIKDEEFFLESSVSLGALFSYLSSIIVKRERWHSTDTNMDLVGSAYIHADKLLSVMFDSSFMVYLPEPLVCSRGGNDSFAKSDMLSRVRLDYDFYFSYLSKKYSGRRLRQIRRVLRCEWSFREVVIRYNLSVDKELKKRMFKMFSHQYGFLLCCVSMNHFVGVLLKIARRAKNVYR